MKAKKFGKILDKARIMAETKITVFKQWKRTKKLRRELKLI